MSLFTSCCWCHQALCCHSGRRLMLEDVVTSSTKWFLLCYWPSNHSLGVFSYVFSCQNPVSASLCWVFFIIKQTKSTLVSLTFHPKEFDNCTQKLKICFLLMFILCLQHFKYIVVTVWFISLIKWCINYISFNVF